MRITEISLGIGGGGGVENVVRDISLGFVRSGDQVTVASSRIDLKGFSVPMNSVGKWNGLNVARVKKYNLPVASIYSFGSNGFTVLKNRKTDIIHAHSLPSPGYLGLRLKEKKKVPLVVTLHGGEVNILSERPAFKQVNQMILDRTDCAVCVSKELKKKVGRMFGIRARYIPNGVDTTRFSPSGKKKEIDVAFVGMFREEKGLLIMLDALKSLKPNVPRTAIVGSGPLRKEVEQGVRKRGLKRFVKIEGFIRNERLPGFLDRCKVFVLPSTTEGMSMALLEAMSCGVVPIVTDVGGNSTVVRQGKEGILFKPGRSSDLALGISSALGDPKLLGSMGKRARIRIRDNYSLKRTLREYKELFQSFV